MKVCFIRLLSMCAVLAMAACVSTSQYQVQQVAKTDFKGRALAEVLSELKSHGISCLLSERYSKDDRLKPLTDGSLKDVQLYDCMKEDNSLLGMCLNRAQIVLLAQHDKVIKLVANSQQQKACLYDH